MSNKHDHYVSVIIPVFNDLIRLKLCLDALEKQTYPKRLYEVIVVDNGSDERIDELVNQFRQAVAIHENRQGSYAARNKGIAFSKGDIIAFTDSDCIPSQEWIDKGVGNLLHVPNCGLVVGRINMFFKDPDKPTAVELYDALTAFPNEHIVNVERFGPTANVFTFRSVIDHIGAFNDNIKSAGDREWGQRVFSFGYQQIYADDTFVSHPARYSLKQLLKRHVRMVGGLHDIESGRNYPFFPFINVLIKDLLPPKIAFVNFFSDMRLKGIKRKFKVVSVMLIVKIMRMWERVRLHFGGISKKGV
jgi:glycosyltransferase involved in cell wall biosynthesis